jgi:hypothetical protein
VGKPFEKVKKVDDNFKLNLNFRDVGYEDVT